MDLPNKYFPREVPFFITESQSTQTYFVIKLIISSHDNVFGNNGGGITSCIPKGLHVPALFLFLYPADALLTEINIGDRCDSFLSPRS